MRQKGVKAREVTIYKGVFIHLNTKYITQMFAFTS